MVVKLFILGSPGSGKSTVIRHIGSLLKEEYQWSSVHINDYPILRDMFIEDLSANTKDRQFEASEHNGFNVLRFAAFDVALQRLEKKAAQLMDQNKAIVTSEPLSLIIEFARNNYVNAFNQFSSGFLRDAYFIYLDTPIDICKKRIQARIAMPPEKQTEDDYYVPEGIFETYYDLNNNGSLAESLEKDCGIDKKRVLVLHNDKKLGAILQEIQIFIRYITHSVK